MPRTSRPPIWRAALPLLLMLLSACGHDSPLRRPPAVPEVPPLPQAARQPERPPICKPTCTEGLTRLRMELLDSLTVPPSPEKPASAPTAR